MLLNIDLGETHGEPEELYALAHLVNIACGGHAGDAASIARALATCRREGALPGAHPSYEDRARFGRVHLDLSADALRSNVATQCARLGSAHHAKPHGALYHAANADPALAEATVAGVRDALGVVAIVGPAGGALEAAARSAGMPFLREVFADRGTRADGTLVPRGEPGALVTDPELAAANARRLVGDTVCVHADTPGAVAIARAVRAVLG